MALLRVTTTVEYEVGPGILALYEDAEDVARVHARGFQEDAGMIGELINDNPDSTEIRVEVVIP